MAAQFATALFYTASGSTNLLWANAVYTKLGLVSTPPEIAALASQGDTVAKRKAAVLAILKGTAYRTKFINDAFVLLLNRPPVASAVVSDIWAIDIGWRG